MTLRVLGRTASINVRKVLWTCGELDLHFEHVESDPRLLAKNPNRLVPVIQDGEFVMWESNAICRYLANKHSRNNLLPGEPEARGLVEQWMDWQATELNPAWRYSFYALVRHSPAHQDRNEIAASIETDLRTFTRVWRGDMSWPQSQRSGAVQGHGTAHVRRNLPRWLPKTGVTVQPQPA